MCEKGAFQDRVQPWMMACFGPEISKDRVERNHRFLEESLELVQSLGCTRSEAHQLVDYSFDRQPGEPDQEVGGVEVTLAALCLANDLNMHEAGERELKRIWQKIDKIRAKQAAKPRHSPLPQAPAPTQGEGSEPVGWQPRRPEKQRAALPKASEWVFALFPSEKDIALHGGYSESRPLYASPPPLPAGNADPRVREALEALRKTQWPFQKVTCAGFKDDYVILRGDRITTGQLRAVSIATRNLAEALAALPSPPSQGLVEAADAAIENIENVIDYPAAIREIIRDYRSRASDRSA